MGGSRRGGSGGGRPSVSPEAVRVVKILGSDVSRSRVVRGFVALRGSESAVSAVTGARVAVFGCGIEASGTEADGSEKGIFARMNYLLQMNCIKAC